MPMGSGETSEHICRCITCGKRLEGRDRVYQVLLVEVGHGIERVLNPTCSEECARKAKEKCVRYFSSILTDVRNQSFQIMTVDNYYGDWSKKNIMGVE